MFSVTSAHRLLPGPLSHESGGQSATILKIVQISTPVRPIATCGEAEGRSGDAAAACPDQESDQVRPTPPVRPSVRPSVRKIGTLVVRALDCYFCVALFTGYEFLRLTPF